MFHYPLSTLFVVTGVRSAVAQRLASEALRGETHIFKVAGIYFEPTDLRGDGSWFRLNSGDGLIIEFRSHFNVCISVTL